MHTKVYILYQILCVLVNYIKGTTHNHKAYTEANGLRIGVHCWLSTIQCKATHRATYSTEGRFHINVAKLDVQ